MGLTLFDLIVVTVLWLIASLIFRNFREPILHSKFRLLAPHMSLRTPWPPGHPVRDAPENLPSRS